MGPRFAVVAYSEEARSGAGDAGPGALPAEETLPLPDPALLGDRGREALEDLLDSGGHDSVGGATGEGAESGEDPLDLTLIRRAAGFAGSPSRRDKEGSERARERERARSLPQASQAMAPVSPILPHSPAEEAITLSLRAAPGRVPGRRLELSRRPVSPADWEAVLVGFGRAQSEQRERDLARVRAEVRRALDDAEAALDANGPLGRETHPAIARAEAVAEVLEDEDLAALREVRERWRRERRAEVGALRGDDLEDQLGAPQGEPDAGGDGTDGSTTRHRRRRELARETRRTTVQDRPAGDFEGRTLGTPTTSRLEDLKGEIMGRVSSLTGKLRRKGRPGWAANEVRPAPERAPESRPPEPDADGGNPGEAPQSSPEDLERRLKLSLRETTVGSMARVCVGSPKGGVGKSSIAYALAGSIAYYTNMRVCLVDADPNFGSTRLLVPRPVDHSVVTLAEAWDSVRGLSDLRAFVAQNELMRLDVVLGPEQANELARFEDLGEAYARIDSVLSRFYDLVIYDLGLGFRDPAIRRVLSLSNELLFVTDSEVIPNAMLADAIKYVDNLGVSLARTTLVLNHRLPPTDESALTPQVRSAHAGLLRRVTEIPYDARMSQLLNQRSFHIESLDPATRLGVLTTVAACLEGLRSAGGPTEKVVPRELVG